MDNLLAYIFMAIIMSVLPGADTVLITKNTLSYGKRGGRATIAGMATGLTFWTIIAVLGLSVVIAQSFILFNVIKYLGAAYLVYLGVKVFLTKSTLTLDVIQVESCNKLAAHSYKECYLQGAISNILNPKTILVYITFMPQFIDVNSNANHQLIFLGLILTLIAVSWFMIFVYFIDHTKKWLNKPKYQLIFQKFIGVMLVGFGVKTAI